MKNILIFIHKFNDIDHLSPIAYSLSKYAKANIKIVSLLPFKQHRGDFRIKFLIKDKNIDFYNFTDVANRSLSNTFLKLIIEAGSIKKKKINKKKLLNIFKFVFTLRSLKKIIFSLLFTIIYKLNFYNFIVSIFCKNLWAEYFFKFFNPSILIYDHGITTGKLATFSPNINIIKIANLKKIPVVSLPHGVPLFKDHPARYDVVKNNIKNDKSDILVLQHKYWKNECSNFGLDRKNVFVLGLPRFSYEWLEILDKIVPKEKLPNTNSINNLKIVYMDSGPNNYTSNINEFYKTIEYLNSNNKISFLYKPHTRNNKMHYYDSKINFVGKINSINLINWADIVIGSTSSIMINVIQMKKIYISASYLLDKKMIFDEYKASINADSFQKMKEIINYFIENKVNFYDHIKKENVEKFINEIVYNSGDKKNLLKNYAEFIKNKMIEKDNV